MFIKQERVETLRHLRRATVGIRLQNFIFHPFFSTIA